MNVIYKLLAPKEFTGWHMVAVISLFFGTIITVNLVLAYNAAGTWTGLIVKNTYVESQNFNKRVSEIENYKSDGWQAKVAYFNGALHVIPLDKQGRFINNAIVTGSLGRPVHENEDRLVFFTLSDGNYISPLTLGNGLWRIQMKVIDDKGRHWIETIRFFVNSQSGA